jgi:hypothetical protein
LQKAACRSGASIIWRARSRLAGVSTSKVAPQAHRLARDQQGLGENIAHDVHIVEDGQNGALFAVPAPHDLQSGRRPFWYRWPPAARPARSRRRPAASRRANNTRCICPPESVPMARRSKPVRPTEASASPMRPRSARPMPPNMPVRRHNPVETRSNTLMGEAAIDFGHLRQIGDPRLVRQRNPAR